MYRALIISLLVLIYGCAAQDGKYIQVIKPQGVPMCSAPTEFPGYHSWRVEAPNVAVVKLFPFHANDMMYKVIGPNAERRMLLAQAEIKNISFEHMVINRTMITIQGEGGMTITSIPPSKILTLARGTQTTADNVFEQLGDGIIDTECSKSIEIDTGETDSMMVAFPLPLPPNPKFVISIENSRVETPICWSD
jgi:hypothetical protein